MILVVYGVLRLQRVLDTTGTTVYRQDMIKESVATHWQVLMRVKLFACHGRFVYIFLRYK